MVRHRFVLGRPASPYNADLFAEMGIEPPSNDPEKAWTWAQFLEVAQAMTVDINEQAPQRGRFRCRQCRTLRRLLATWWIPLHSAILANGGDWTDAETGLFVLDKPEATEALAEHRRSLQ